MARERYLIGVSEDELRPSLPRQTAPQTPRSWLENFWYHHKAGVIVGFFSLMLAVLLLVQVLTRVRPDYTIVLATDDGYSAESIAYFERTLELYGEDVNGDGKVVVEIGSLSLAAKDNMQYAANAQALQTRLITGDTVFYIFEPQYIERFIAVGRDNAHCFLTELPLTADGTSKDKLYWSWAADERHAEDPVLSMFPQELCFGVRYAKPNDEESAAKYAQCVALLTAYATNTPNK